MKKNNYLLILLSFLIFPACQVDYNIIINPNKTATINKKIHFYSVKELKKKFPNDIEKTAVYEGLDDYKSSIPNFYLLDSIYNNPLISDFIWKRSKKAHYEGQYNITNIDSVGRYLDPLDHFVSPTFNFSENSLLITCPPGDTSHVFKDDVFYIKIDTKINVPFSIKSIQCNNSKINTRFEDKTIYIQCYLNQLFYTDKNTILNIEFSH